MIHDTRTCCRALGSRAVTTCYNDRSVATGNPTPISQTRAEHCITKPPRQFGWDYQQLTIKMFLCIQLSMLNCLFSENELVTNCIYVRYQGWERNDMLTSDA